RLPRLDPLRASGRPSSKPRTFALIHYRAATAPPPNQRVNVTVQAPASGAPGIGEPRSLWRTSVRTTRSRKGGGDMAEARDDRHQVFMPRAGAGRRSPAVLVMLLL